MVVFWVGLWLTLFCSQVNSECQAWNSSVPRGNTEMLMHLTDTCRYDRWTRPGNSSNPLMVLVRIHVYFLGSIEAQSLQFTAHILIRLRWLDTRLDYKDLAPGVSQVVSEGFLKDRIWTPHIYLVNEQDSVVMGAERHDLLISVQPDGTVIFSSRMKVTLSCLMDLQKFPFDHQKCPMILESWTYNSSELTLSWESNTAVTVDEHLHLPEYRLLDTWSDFSLASYSLTEQHNSSSTEPRYYGKFGQCVTVLRWGQQNK